MLMLERIGYLLLDMGVGVTLIAYQADHAPDAEFTLFLAGGVMCLTIVDLLLTWRRLPHRLLTIVTYLGLVAMFVSGFFTGIGILWAIANGVVFFFWAAMYRVIQIVLEERP